MHHRANFVPRVRKPGVPGDTALLGYRGVQHGHVHPYEPAHGRGPQDAEGAAGAALRGQQGDRGDGRTGDRAVRHPRPVRLRQRRRGTEQRGDRPHLRRAGFARHHRDQHLPGDRHRGVPGDHPHDHDLRSRPMAKFVILTRLSTARAPERDARPRPPAGHRRGAARGRWAHRGAVRPPRHAGLPHRRRRPGAARRLPALGGRSGRRGPGAGDLPGHGPRPVRPPGQPDDRDRRTAPLADHPAGAGRAQPDAVAVLRDHGAQVLQAARGPRRRAPGRLSAGRPSSSATTRATWTRW